MSIYKEKVTDEKYIEFKNQITLLNKVKGKQIIINGEKSNYIITKKGKVFNIKTENELKPHMSYESGYLVVGLSFHGKEKTKSIHRLLALSYIPNPENKPIVNHKDGDKLNCDLSNLEWNTYSENNLHAYRNKLKSPNFVEGERCNLSTHTKEDAIAVCELLSQGKSPLEISRSNPKYGKDFVRRIHTRQTWKSVSKEYIFPSVPHLKKHSYVFTYEDLMKIQELSIAGNSVNEIIFLMKWEKTEKLRSNVKYYRKRFLDEYNKTCNNT